ncbi:MAG: PEP-CTERM sorting domain-containing protein [Chthonomonas sp.]|nr:PEP-CTERM sorting domain-containing protein [Chthonomonas sp.]
MRTIFAGISLAFTGFALASPPQYKVEKLFQLSSPSVAAKYRTVSEFTSNGRIIYDDDAPNLQTGKFEYVAGGSTNISKLILGNSSDPRAIYRSESGKYAVAPDWDHGGFLRDGLTGENYGPRPFPDHESINVMGITERYTFGSSFFDQRSHTYSEVAYIYDHITRTRYDLNPNNFESDKRRTTAMNEAGQAVVEYFPGPEPYQPINVEQCELWQNGVRRVIGQMSDAKINSSGQVIGRVSNWRDPNFGKMQFWDGTATQAFTYDDGNPTSLSDNNHALVTFNVDNAYYPSKLLDVNTRTGYDLHDLTPNMPAGMITYHGLIRADGAIAAIGVENGKSYLLKFTPVPEPASLLALGVGLAFVVRRRRV